MDVQLKRGLLDVCVLAAIRTEDSYGYQIIRDNKDIEKTDKTIITGRIIPINLFILNLLNVIKPAEVNYSDRQKTVEIQWAYSSRCFSSSISFLFIFI